MRRAGSRPTVCRSSCPVRLGRSRSRAAAASAAMSAGPVPQQPPSHVAPNAVHARDGGRVVRVRGVRDPARERRRPSGRPRSGRRSGAGRWRRAAACQQRRHVARGRAVDPDRDDARDAAPSATAAAIGSPAAVVAAVTARGSQPGRCAPTRRAGRRGPPPRGRSGSSRRRAGRRRPRAGPRSAARWKSRRAVGPGS